MYGHPFFVHIYIQNTVSDRRKQDLLSFRCLHCIDIIGTSLDHIGQRSKNLAFICHHFHVDKVRNKIFVFSKLHCMFSVHQQIFFQIFLDIVNIIISFELQDHLVLEEFHAFDFKNLVFPSCIQDYFIKIQKTFRIIGRGIYFYFSADSMGTGNHTYS